MTLVVDASVIVAALGTFRNESRNRWASSLVLEEQLACPEITRVETANALRQLQLRGEVSPHEAETAFARMMGLPIQLFPSAPFIRRIWELRYNIVSYDAWYVALAESLNCPLATCDGRLARASGPTCAFIVPPGNI